MRETLFDYCKRTGELELLRQWNSERNGALTPETVSYGSKKKVWWRCGKGHEWQAEVTSRTSNHTGCPLLQGRHGVAGIDGFCHAMAGAGRPVAPDQKRSAHPERGAPRQPPEGVVALREGP